MSSIEPWLRGTETDVPAVGRAVLRAVQLAEEDLQKWCGNLSDAEVNVRPAGAARGRTLAGRIWKRREPWERSGCQLRWEDCLSTWRTTRSGMWGKRSRRRRSWWEWAFPSVASRKFAT